jgi:hypothetical protein
MALALVQVSLGALAMSRLGPRHIFRLAADPSSVKLAGLAHQPLTVGIVMYLTLFLLGGLVLLIIGLTYWVKGLNARRLPAVHRVR